MTKDECRAKIVENQLGGTNHTRWSNGLRRAQLTYGCCSECGHNLYVTRVSYGTGEHRRPWDPQVVSCKCGKISRLWLYDKFHLPCEKCKQLPAPATGKFKPRWQGVDEQGKPKIHVGEEVSLPKFICPCGLTQPHKDTGNKPLNIHTLG
jgi:hypothetical protein